MVGGSLKAEEAVTCLCCVVKVMKRLRKNVKDSTKVESFRRKEEVLEVSSSYTEPGYV